MSRSLIPAQHKLAEKLTILNHRAVGMLTRIYNIKKVQWQDDLTLLGVFRVTSDHLPAKPGNCGEFDSW